MSWLHIAVILPLIFALIIPILYRFFKRIHLGWFVLPVPIVIFIYLLSLIQTMMSGHTVMKTLNWMPHFGMNFNLYLDGLSLLFSLLITGIGSLVVLYSIGYLSKSEQLGNFYCYLLLFMGAMLGVVLSDNVIILYLFWELTSFSSFLLISFWRERQASIYGAQKSLIITVLGGLSLLGGLILLSLSTNSFSIQYMIQHISDIHNSPYFIFAMILIMLGAFTKSAQFPFYIWLPDAMEAPTPVSAYLHSATMVKAGLYLIARMTPIFAISAGWIWTVTVVGLITLFWASLNATKQQDLKGILAFSTVSQLGMIMSMLGIGAVSYHFQGANSQIYAAAFTAAIFHLINHATFKGALFMVTGAVDHATGTRDIKKLGGLLTIMPISFTITVITALSMAGIPPFNGFLSKESFLDAMINVTHANIFSLNGLGILFPIVAIIGSIFTFVYSIKFIMSIFFGHYQPEKLPKQAHEVSLLMLISPAILAILVIVFGLFPGILTNSIIQPATVAINQSTIDNIEFHLFHGITPAFISTLAIYITGIILILTFSHWIRLLQQQPTQLTLNYWYNRSGDYMPSISKNMTDSYVTDYSRNNLVIIFGVLILLTVTTLLSVPFHVSFKDVSPIRLFELGIVVLLLSAAFLIVFAKSRLFSIIMLSAVGYAVSVLFIFFKAPDLALTQFVVESISTALFLLCFYHLPNLNRYNEKRSFKITNALISAGVGLVVIVIGLIAYGNRHYDSIAKYYQDHVYDLAHGKNMVNVILVDFRGMDTLFESSVLGIAGLAVYTMIKLRKKPKQQSEVKNHE
ncbi:Na+/H+ antiporter subunit A [Staphylococcus simiae]|uniref:Na+/H+ antiporter subunit A n=1 Tax=Staphylococcus simiae TaxID=308354 RepID=UPI001A967B07|nr:Na+/H+ antiporter subunit A [Staphylococcus simiae]MBO1199374.1 Na+/H+ antiporter subunit A [Staphylococcus simiae]MBO1201675.1 Na+/H+ antiporter subunit A [Staphylococcus simiae]MBO1203857.1 Na+/H+ antiporter subunit A [Staphylococcus simiae]MBO1211356.1 Na+/H+ antiporter subunit A [Staphylococcus simiae]MBO1230056.1 Na+/H+ antiporter subunit A [Staphylococcus simiae]